MNSNNSFITTNDFFSLAIIDVGIIVMALLLWRWWWVSTNRLKIPDFYQTDSLFYHEISRDGDQVVLTSIWETFSLLRSIISEFDH